MTKSNANKCLEILAFYNKHKNLFRAQPEEIKYDHKAINKGHIAEWKRVKKIAKLSHSANVK
jgi:hypothetical protein